MRFLSLTVALLVLAATALAGNVLDLTATKDFDKHIASRRASSSSTMHPGVDTARTLRLSTKKSLTLLLSRRTPS